MLHCRWFPRAAGTYFNVPLLGAVSVLSVTVAPFCLTFAILWGVYRQLSFAWIGQDILVCTSSDLLYLIFVFPFSQSSTGDICLFVYLSFNLSLYSHYCLMSMQCVILNYQVSYVTLSLLLHILIP